MVHLVHLHPQTSCSSVSFVLAAFGSAVAEVLMEPPETGAEGTVRTLVQVLLSALVLVLVLTAGRRAPLPLQTLTAERFLFTLFCSVFMIRIHLWIRTRVLLSGSHLWVTLIIRFTSFPCGSAVSGQKVLKQHRVVPGCKEADVAVEEFGCALVENHFTQTAHTHVLTVEGVLRAHVDLEREPGAASVTAVRTLCSGARHPTLHICCGQHLGFRFFTGSLTNPGAFTIAVGHSLKKTNRTVRRKR